MKSRRIVSLSICLSLLVAALNSTAQSTTQQSPPLTFYKSDETAMPKEFSLDLSPEYFIWEEDTPVGKVRETGPRVQLGLTYREQKERGWLFGAILRGYYGNVQYNGFNQILNSDGSVTFTPATTRTEYVGGLVEAQALWKSPLTEDYSGSWKGAVGADIWDRSLSGSGGYDELWTVAYARGGYEIAPQNQTGWLGDVGIKMPMNAANTANFPGFGHVTVHPKPRPSGYLEGGYKFNNTLALTAYFDSYWFGQSRVVDGLLQPESRQYQIGLRLKWSFE